MPMDEINREAIYKKTVTIVMDVLGVEENEVSPDSMLINELGAESIDFLDLSFQIESEFNVKFPEREIGQLGGVIRDKRLRVIEDMLRSKYDIILAEEERHEIMDLPLSSVADYLSSSYDIEIGANLIEQGSNSIIGQIIEYLSELNFIVSSNDILNFANVTIEDSPQKIQREIVGRFTVKLLSDFVYQSQINQSEMRKESFVS